MTNTKNAAFDYFEDCIIESKKVALLAHDTANSRILIRINWIIILTIIASILFCQITESTAERQVLSCHGEGRYDRRCSNNMRRSMGSTGPILQNVIEDPALTPQSILLRLEAAAILRDNLVTALGHVLLLCLDDDARIPFERVHDAVQNRQVAIYELLDILPVLKDMIPKKQLYKLLQMLERIGSRFISEYASLSLNVFPNINADLEGVPLADMLLNIDEEVINLVSRDKDRVGKVSPSLINDIHFLLRETRNDSQILNMNIVSAILLNYPVFDLTDPEIPNAIRFVAQQMKQRSRSEDPLLQYLNLEDATGFLKIVLERLEIDKLTSEATKEAISLLLQNFGMESYPSAPKWKDNLKKVLIITNDYYPTNVTVVAKYLADHLNDSHFKELDIGFYETGDHALLQVLSRLRRRSNLQHLQKPLSLLIPFVSQKLINDVNYQFTEPVSFYEVNNYLDSFDMPCLQQNINNAMTMLRPYLSENLPWTYAFGDRRMSNNPWELILTSLIHLRNVPMKKSQATLIDNFIYKVDSNGLISSRGPLYDSGIIFQRDDSMDVEIDFYSLLMCIPNAFQDKKFIPMLNFFSKPNILDILGYKFNKFEYQTSRSLLLALLERALTLSFVKSDKSLFNALKDARSYLKEPLLINLYTLNDLQLLLKYLPNIESESRYLPLKILFQKQKLFSYLSPSFNLAGMHTPIKKLSLILEATSLKATEPKIFEALTVALENIDGQLLPVKTFDRDDFVYLTNQLLSHHKTIQDQILTSSAYMTVDKWNISISGTPNNVLARILSYPINDIMTDANLNNIVKQAEDILEKEDLMDIEILRKQTLEAMLEYLPNMPYIKPLILLLRKSNLMTYVPKLNLKIIENATAHDGLIMILKDLAESRIVRMERSMLRRVRAALSSLDGGSEDYHQTSILTYLIQSLQDPSNVVYKPLFREISKLQDITVSYEKRQTWLQHYLQNIITKSNSEELRKAALTALREITYDESIDKKSRVIKSMISKATSFLPIDFYAKPMEKLLTPDWVYGILPKEIRNSTSFDEKEFLLVILHYAKQRVDIANNPALMKAISKIEMNLNGWKTNVESLRRVVAAMKTAVYDPVKDILTAARLNTLKVTIPSGRSAKALLLGLLHRLLAHPIIKKHNNVFKLLSIVREDVLAFGIEVDLLSVLDDAGIPYISNLAPIRLFLHRKDINAKFGKVVFPIKDFKKRYRMLVKILQEQYQMYNDTQFLEALTILKKIRPSKEKLAQTQISDLYDIVNAIPYRIRQQFKSIRHLFNVNILSRLMRNKEVITSRTPITTLLLKMTNLPEISSNYTIVSELNNLRFKVEQLGNHPVVIGFQLRPLLLELRHIEQINVDYLNAILSPEILSYLHLDEFSKMSDNSTEILETIINYLLYQGPAYSDINMQKHLHSFQSALQLTMHKTSKNKLTKGDWTKMLSLIPQEKDFASIRIFLQSKKMLDYIPENINWKLFSTPSKKLLYLLSLLDSNKIKNKNVYKSASKLRNNLEERFNFITEKDVKNMHYILASHKLKHDLVPLKIFLNHDNMIKYLPSHFRYTNYNTSIDAFVAVLNYLLRVPSIKQRSILYNNIMFIRQSLLGRNFLTRRSFSGSRASLHPSSEDFEFINLLNISLPTLRKFLNPETLASLLPKSFTFDNRPTFKMKALHLLHELLKLNTSVHSELKGLLQEVEIYPDVPNITEDDLVPLLNIFPTEGIPHVELVRKYLKSSTLIKLLPGNFDIKKQINTKTALQNILLLLSVSLGSAKDEKLKIALDTVISELKKISSDVILKEPMVDRNDIRSIIKEIPFNEYQQIQQLQTMMKTETVISSLPLNFQLTEYKTKKLRVLAVLDELSKSKTFEPWRVRINFAERIISKMPDVPTVNDTEIEELLSPLSLNALHIKQLITNCKVAILMPHLPINFNLSSIESRKKKITEILQYCKLSNPWDVSTQQTLFNAESVLKTLPDFDVTRDHVEALIRMIPCKHFTLLKPLLKFLSKVDVTPLLPWDLDMYKSSHTFKMRIFDLLTALRNVKELQNEQMFAALDTLESNTKSLSDKPWIPPNLYLLTDFNHSWTQDTMLCDDYRKFMTSEKLDHILPPATKFHLVWYYQTIEGEWSRIMYYSKLFVRDVRINGPTKNAFDACVKRVRAYGKGQVYYYITSTLKTASFQQLVPLRLYILGHVNFTEPIEDVYRGFSHGPLRNAIRVALREFIRRPELTKSKSLISDLKAFLLQTFHTKHDDYYASLRPSYYEINRAIDEIPSENKYDHLRLLMQCPDILTPIMEKDMLGDGTSKELLLEMLKQAEKSDIDEEIRNNIKTIKPILEKGIREEEVDNVLQEMRNYKYYMDTMKFLRSDMISYGLQSYLGNGYRARLPSYKDRLLEYNKIVSRAITTSPHLYYYGYLKAARLLNRTLNNEIKIKPVIPKNMDDINIQSLFLALPKTRDERIIHGIIKFFSIPNLLRKLNLPKDPFEYVTKGRLLQVIMDLGQELESVQEDPIQQEALGYFRDKILTTGPGMKPIELKKYASDFNINVDMYGMMRAINFTKVEEDTAVAVATFLHHKYNNLVHAAGFDHTAYETRGTYLKALFEHLVNVSHVPHDVKEKIMLLIPAVDLNGPGNENIDLNEDLVSEETPNFRMFGGLLGAAYDAKSRVSKPITDFETKLLNTFQENKRSLKAAVDDMFKNILSSEEKYFEQLSGQSTVYKDNRQKLSPKTIKHHTQSQIRNIMDKFSPSLKNSARTKQKNDWSKMKSLLNNINMPVKKVHKHKVAENEEHIKSNNDSSWQAKSDSPSQQLPSKKLPKKSRYHHRTRHKSMAPRLFIRPDASTDVEYLDGSNGNVPIVRMSRNML